MPPRNAPLHDDRPQDTRRSRRARRAGERAPTPVDVTAVVIGAGQAGLAAAYHLRTSGMVAVGEPGWESADETFVVLDDAPQAGGAWQHRWPGLTMADAHGVHDLPGMPLVAPDPAEPAAFAVPYYFAQYEEAFDLRVQRPVRVTRVHRRRGLPDGLLAERRPPRGGRRCGGPGDWSTHPGTWQKPFWPAYRGAGRSGRQLHSHDFRLPEDLADGHVVVIGGGTSAVQQQLAIAGVTTTTWVTRRAPVWRGRTVHARGRPGRRRAGRRAHPRRAATAEHRQRDRPAADARRTASASPPGSCARRPMFSRHHPRRRRVGRRPTAGRGLGRRPGARRGAHAPVVHRLPAALDHLAPLGLRAPGGGIVMDGTQVVADPRIQLVGYGPSASTIGANRAGREAPGSCGGCGKNSGMEHSVPIC